MVVLLPQAHLGKVESVVQLQAVVEQVFRGNEENARKNLKMVRYKGKRCLRAVGVTVFSAEWGLLCLPASPLAVLRCDNVYVCTPCFRRRS